MAARCEFVQVSRILVVLSDAFADLRRGHPYDRVGSGIVAGVPAEDFNPESSFLELVASPFEGLLDDEAEETWESAYYGKVGILQEPIELPRDLSFPFHRKARLRRCLAPDS